MRFGGWVVVALFSVLSAGSSAKFAEMPEAPPSRPSPPTANPVIRLRIVVDEAFTAQHGDNTDAFVREMLAIHNIEWRRVRSEWFVLDSFAIQPSAKMRDATWLLANLVSRTAREADAIQVMITGEPLEVYSNGVSPRPVGGLAYRGSDAVVVSASPGVTPDLAAYYLFHEIGHCFDAFDLPFGGGHSTFGSKRFATFDVDAGNEQIIEDSPGPRARDTPSLAPAFIRAKFAAARAVTRNPALYRRLHDLAMHEPSRANRAYVRKRDALLAVAGKERRAISRFLARYEITPRQARADAAARQALAEQYWIANAAISRGDLAAAQQALLTISCLQEAQDGDTHLLVAAAGKKARRGRR